MFVTCSLDILKINALNGRALNWLFIDKKYTVGLLSRILVGIINESIAFYASTTSVIRTLSDPSLLVF